MGPRCEIGLPSDDITTLCVWVVCFVVLVGCVARRAAGEKKNPPEGGVPGRSPGFPSSWGQVHTSIHRFLLRRSTYAPRI